MPLVHFDHTGIKIRYGTGFRRPPLLPELLHNVIYLDRVPVQNGVRHKTETAGLIHYFLIITGSELTLVGKEDPARQLVPVFSFIQLPLDGASGSPQY